MPALDIAFLVMQGDGAADFLMRGILGARFVAFRTRAVSAPAGPDG